MAAEAKKKLQGRWAKLDPFARLSGSLILDPGRREWWERRGLWRFTVAGGFPPLPSSLIQSIPGLERCWAAKYNVGEDVSSSGWISSLPPTPSPLEKYQNKSVFPSPLLDRYLACAWARQTKPHLGGIRTSGGCVTLPPPSLQTLTKTHIGE